MFCGNCGKQISDTSKFCRYCGAPVMRTEPPRQEPVQEVYQGDQQPYPNEMNDSYDGGIWQPEQPPYLNESPRYSDGVPYPRQQIHNQPQGMPYRKAGDAAAGAAYRAGKGAVRAGGKARLYGMLSFLTVLVLLLVVMVYNLFIKSGKPEDTIADLEEAINKLDTEAMLECFDEQTQSLYSGSLGLAESISGIDLGSLAELGSGLGGLMAGTGLTPQVSLVVIDVEYSDNETCMVTVDMTMTYQGESQSQNQQLPMKKDGRKWVISVGSLEDFLYY